MICLRTQQQRTMNEALLDTPSQLPFLSFFSSFCHFYGLFPRARQTLEETFRCCVSKDNSETRRGAHEVPRRVVGIPQIARRKEEWNSSLAHATRPTGVARPPRARQFQREREGAIRSDGSFDSTLNSRNNQHTYRDSRVSSLFFFFFFFSFCGSMKGKAAAAVGNVCSHSEWVSGRVS